MYGKNKVIRKKVIFLSGSAKFSFAYPQYSHLHIRNFSNFSLRPAEKPNPPIKPLPYSPNHPYINYPFFY